MRMKARYYKKNPVALWCFLLGHTPDDDMEHSLCGGSSTLTFCKRCCYLYRNEGGRWIGEDDNE